MGRILEILLQKLHPKIEPPHADEVAEMTEMNPVAPTSLEEEVVAQMAPIGKSSLIT